MANDDDFLNGVKERYKESVAGWDHVYDQASEDFKFVYDVDEGQWPTTIRQQREADNRPVLTINKLQKFVRQIRGDQMINRPRIKVIPVDSKADPDMAKLYNGLIRQIEYLSTAETAYDTAYMHAISSSLGFFRLITKYLDDNSFDQDLLIKRIINPLAVHFDPYAVEFTFEDARYCFLEELIDRNEYKRMYPKAEATDFDSSSVATLFGDWLQGEKVRVAEYFYKEPVEKKIVLFDNGEVVDVADKERMGILIAAGGDVVRERTVESHIVKWKKLSGAEILAEKDWPGKYIPVIPVFGDEIVAEGKRYYLSLTRGAKDMQRMYNYWATSATETVALAPKNPFIVDHRQIKGFETEWEDAHLNNRMFIRYNAVAGLQKPSREPQVQVPTGIMSMMQISGYDIEDHLGRYEASQGEASNERSGRAILARVAQSDKGTYTFVDNLKRSIVYAGRQLIDLIPKIYDTPRALRVLGEDGNEEIVDVNQPIPTPGGVVTVNDLSVGKYDIIATVGASFSSKRQEMVDMMVQTLQYAPDLSPIIAPLIFKYSDWPGAEEIYNEIQKRIQQAQQVQQQ